LSLLSIIMKI